MTIEKTVAYTRHALIDQLTKSNAFILYLGPDMLRLFNDIRNHESTASVIHLTDMSGQIIQEIISNAINDAKRNFTHTYDLRDYPGTILLVDATASTDKRISDEFWALISQQYIKTDDPNPSQKIYVVFLGNLEFLPEDLHQFSTTPK